MGRPRLNRHGEGDAGEIMVLAPTYFTMRKLKDREVKGLSQGRKWGIWNLRPGSVSSHPASCNTQYCEQQGDNEDFLRQPQTDFVEQSCWQL